MIDRAAGRLTVVAVVVLIFGGGPASPTARGESPQGRCFSKKRYEPHPLPAFADAKDRLPSPVYDENPLYVQMYWKTWQLAFGNLHEPTPQSGFVSQFIDASFNENIFLWDTCFLTMFCNYGHPWCAGHRFVGQFLRQAA